MHFGFGYETTVMGCFLSRCGQHAPKLRRSLPVAPRAGPENEGEEFTAGHRRANVIVYRRQNLGTQIMENAFEDQALNLETIGDQNSEEGSLSSNDGTFSKPAADSMATNGLRQLDRRPADFGDTSSDAGLPILDHEMLWEILSARPGWEREVQKGTEGITKGFVQYHIGALKTKKLLPFHSACPLACRLPWPGLYEASTYMLSSFVETVNMCTGSEIFELRITNDRQPGSTNNIVEYTRVTAKLAPRPETGTSGYGSQGDCLRTTMEGSRLSTIATSMFCNSSQATQDVDLDSVERTPTSDHIPIATEMQLVLRPRTRKRGPIRKPTGEQPAVRNSEDPGCSKASEQTLALQPDLFANIPKPDGRPPPVFFSGKPAILQSSSAEAAPAGDKLFTSAAPPKPIRNSEDLRRGEAARQTSGVPPSGLFANVPKPDGRPPPVCSKQSSFQLSAAKRIRTGPGPETRLFTSDALQKISEDFDSASVRPLPRQELVTFATPYQTPYRGTTSAYVRNEYPNLQKHLLLKDFLAPVMGSGSRLTL